MAKVIRKAQPSLEQVHIDKPLTNMSVAYMQDTTEFIADEVFPNVPVDKKSDKYYVYDKNDWFRDEAEKRAPASESTGGGYNLSDDDYSCDVWAFHKDVDAQTESNSDSQINDYQDATEFVTRILLIRRERLFVSNYLTSSPWDNSDTGDDDGEGGDFVHWDDKTNSTPIDDVAERKRAVKNSTGFMPNVFVIGGSVWDDLRRHPDIIDLVKYTQTAITLSPELIASALDIEKLVIAEGIYATNEEGEDGSYDEIVGKDGLLVYAAPRPRMKQPSGGYIFTWNGYGGSNPYGVTIARMPVPLKKAERVEGEMTFDMRVIGSDLGYFLEDLIS